MLTQMAQQPRKEQFFVTGRQVNPAAINGYLLEMQESGLCIDDDGVWSITTLGRQTLDGKKDVAEQRRIIPTGTYNGEELRPYQGRPGSLDFLKYPSRGF
jgi:hypothetical protein